MTVTFNYDNTATWSQDGFTLTARIERDNDHGAPWDEECGHGPVSDWERRDKLPGELVLCEDRTSKRFYDFAEACRIARREDWGFLPGKLITEQHGPSWHAYVPNTEFQAWAHDINDAIRTVHAAHRATFPSARAYRAAAARADFELLRKWCNDDWYYVGVIVKVSRNGIELGSASLWGIESDAIEHLCDTALELASEAIEQARDAIAALGEPDATLTEH
jgi:hypothetical protein